MSLKSELLSILLSALLGLIYTVFFVDKNLILLVIFGLQILRSGLAIKRNSPSD
ncbi:MAG: hypothetical protein ACE5HS_05010 [bacterium]